MADKLAGCINYLITVGLMLFALSILKKKSIENPNMEFAGFSIKSIITIVYIGIGIAVILIIAVLAGLING